MARDPQGWPQIRSAQRVLIPDQRPETPNRPGYSGRDEATPEPFPLHLLPDGMRDLCSAVIDEVQCADSVAFHSILTTVAFITQGHFNIEHKEGRVIATSIYALTIAGQSERKSGADKATSAFLEDLLRRNTRRQTAQMKKYDADLIVYEATEKALRKELDSALKAGDANVHEVAKKLEDLEKPEPPLRPGFKYADVTWEGLLFRACVRSAVRLAAQRRGRDPARRTELFSGKVSPDIWKVEQALGRRSGRQDEGNT
jgi:hypothetical protein